MPITGADYYCTKPGHGAHSGPACPSCRTDRRRREGGIDYCDECDMNHTPGYRCTKAKERREREQLAKDVAKEISELAPSTVGVRPEDFAEAVQRLWTIYSRPKDERYRDRQDARLALVLLGEFEKGGKA